MFFNVPVICMSTTELHILSPCTLMVSHLYSINIRIIAGILKYKLKFKMQREFFAWTAVNVFSTHQTSQFPSKVTVQYIVFWNIKQQNFLLLWGQWASSPHLHFQNTFFLFHLNKDISWPTFVQHSSSILPCIYIFLQTLILVTCGLLAACKEPCSGLSLNNLSLAEKNPILLPGMRMERGK